MKDRFPVPLIEDFMDELHASTIFSKLDMQSEFHQLLMAHGEQHKTTFQNHSGHFKYLVMPFGLTDALASFQALMNQVLVAKLLGFDFDIQYKKGSSNMDAYALVSTKDGAELLAWVLNNVALQGLKLQVLSNPALHPHFSVLDNLLYRKQKLVIPNDGQVRLVILQWLHSSHQGGHSGIRASIARIKSMFYWKGLAKDVTKFIQQCETCLRCKYEPRAVAGLLQPLPGNLVRAQARMKRQADKHRSDREFKEGDWVFLKLQPYRQASAQYRASEKLSPRFYGPYQVLHRMGKVAYTLILPSTSQIHPTFHVSLLKPCPDENIPVVALPEEWGSLDDPKEPFKILKRRSIQRHNRAVTEVFIQWKGEAMEEATWELLYKLKLQFPYFDVTAVP
ncbi:hypothetical protein KIW84_034381 [Lathyrus oleraceus]|uniref:Chromo domain-containing protein n=1 Tax=Pisum sativum TaxID=3888 RepID=A0A9D4Y3U2_PEA|nr:hypothetical protein KIW84_034381 [Pisum sativum]